MKTMKNQGIQICLLVVLGCLLMTLVEALWQPTYFYKSFSKITIFSLCMGTYAVLNKDAGLFKILQPTTKKQVLASLLAGIGVYCVILLAYFIAKSFIDLNGIAANLLQKETISKANFIYIALYICLVNSFLEEFFFRGFAFLQLKRFAKQKFAYWFSALAFALYHIFIMSGWFSYGIFALLLLALIAAGLIFNYFDRKGTIYNSWLIHLSANLAINTIGFMMFDLL